MLALPNAPVSEIVGKYSAFAAPICALAAISSCSDCVRSGRRSRSSDGTPAGTVGAARSSIDLAALDRPRIAPEQDRQRILGLRDLRFDQRNLRGGSLVLRLRLRDVHLRDLSVLELQLEEPDRLAIRAQRLLGDRELRVEAAQLDVRSRD